jgi:hypothetical protein
MDFERSSRRSWTLFLAVLAAASVGVTPESKERETVVRVVTRWDSDCDGGNRSAWDDMADAWYDEITNDDSEPNGQGSRAWWKGGFYHNGEIIDGDFTDPDIVSWGNDDGTDRLDKADAYMVALHGGDASDGRWIGRVRVDEDGGGNCDAYQGSIELGDGDDLEFLHLSSCNSMDEDDWWDEWNDTFDRLHQVSGFHGIMWIHSSYTSDYEDFAEDGFDDTIMEGWMYNMYKSDVKNDGDSDQCPVERAVGTTREECLDRMDTERYDDVLTDPEGNDESRWECVYFWDGCDPRGKDELSAEEGS